MGIRVECPHGHVFKVKDKYAGKKGLCPHCEGQVIVHVPDALTGDMSDVLQKEAIQRRQATHHHAASSSSNIFDDPGELATTASASGTSGSLLGSSVIRHNIKCKCGEHVPMWYARCPACGSYLEH
ncbi:MAG TPA: hypothetical protein VGK58_22580 [Lacipirellulaceae bacterium]